MGHADRAGRGGDVVTAPDPDEIEFLRGLDAPGAMIDGDSDTRYDRPSLATIAQRVRERRPGWVPDDAPSAQEAWAMLQVVRRRPAPIGPSHVEVPDGVGRREMQDTADWLRSYGTALATRCRWPEAAAQRSIPDEEIAFRRGDLDAIERDRQRQAARAAGTTGRPAALDRDGAVRHRGLVVSAVERVEPADAIEVPGLASDRVPKSAGWAEEYASADLRTLEAVVDRGLRDFCRVGLALTAIRGRHLWRHTHGTWEAYCRDRWGLGRSRAHQLMSAAATSTRVDARAADQELSVAVGTEREARELQRLDDHSLAPTVLIVARNEAGTLTSHLLRAAVEAVNAAGGRDVGQVAAQAVRAAMPGRSDPSTADRPEASPAVAPEAAGTTGDAEQREVDRLRDPSLRPVVLAAWRDESGGSSLDVLRQVVDVVAAAPPGRARTLAAETARALRPRETPEVVEHRPRRRMSSTAGEEVAEGPPPEMSADLHRRLAEAARVGADRVAHPTRLRSWPEYAPQLGSEYGMPLQLALLRITEAAANYLGAVDVDDPRGDWDDALRQAGERVAMMREVLAATQHATSD